MQANPPRFPRVFCCARLLLALVLLAAPLGIAWPSLAGEPGAVIQAESLEPSDPPSEAPQLEGFEPAGMDQPDADETPLREQAELSSLDDSMLNPNAYDAQRAETHPFARLRLFAGSRGFRMGREDTVYDVEGGASFRFFENFFLTGSYRILDYELDGDSFEIEDAGPLFGVMLRF